VSYDTPNINGATPCGESKSVDSSKPQPSRPTPMGAGGGQGGLGGTKR